MKKQIASLLACAMLLLSLVGCGSMYHEADMIGKTSAQIEAEFGRFDCCGMPAGADGLYRNTACGYTIQEAKANFLGKDPEILFLITFDENGIAVSCREDVRPGG